MNDNDEAREVTERDETFQHISRTDLPWRAATRTRCGLIVESLKPAALITAAEAGAKWKRMGQQRASLFLCMTCVNHAGPGSWPEWDADPVGRFERELGNGFGRRVDGLRLIEIELRAIAMLIEHHRDEFDEFVRLMQAGEVVTMQSLRAAADAKKDTPKRGRR